MSEIESSSNCRISRKVIIKAPGLLPMLYTPREIAEDLDLPETTLRDWLNHGAPHSRDASNHIWINGREFAAWVESRRKTKKISTHKLQVGEGFCMRCNVIVTILNTEIRPIKGHLSHLKGNCPSCGGIVNRGIWNAGSSKLSQS
jgi:hypothetical protein